jgi:phosphatidylglycerol:prolipoprotein diacylglycerol transferase
MFINNLDPVAVTIFNIDIRWYSLAYIFGLILAIQFGKFLIKKTISLTLIRTYSMNIYLSL